MKLTHTILLLAFTIIMYSPCEAKTFTDQGESINSGGTPAPRPDNGEDSATDKDENCPPNDRNCNGIPDDKECISIDPSDDGTTDTEEEETGEECLSSSQNKCKYSVNEIDEFTSVLKKYTKLKWVGRSGGAYFFMQLRNFNYKKLIYLQYGGDIGCATKDSYLFIKLDNDEILKLFNIGDIKCGDGYSMYFELSNENIAALKEFEISKLRVYGTEGYGETTKIKLPKYFIDNLGCIE